MPAARGAQEALNNLPVRDRGDLVAAPGCDVRCSSLSCLARLASSHTWRNASGRAFKASLGHSLLPKEPATQGMAKYLPLTLSSYRRA